MESDPDADPKALRQNNSNKKQQNRRRKRDDWLRNPPLPTHATTSYNAWFRQPAETEDVVSLAKTTKWRKSAVSNNPDQSSSEGIPVSNSENDEIMDIEPHQHSHGPGMAGHEHDVDDDDDDDDHTATSSCDDAITLTESCFSSISITTTISSWANTRQEQGNYDLCAVDAAGDMVEPAPDDVTCSATDAANIANDIDSSNSDSVIQGKLIVLLCLCQQNNLCRLSLKVLAPNRPSKINYVFYVRTC